MRVSYVDYRCEERERGRERWRIEEVGKVMSRCFDAQ